jgi:ABC-type glutathione transport system ATPase component
MARNGLAPDETPAPLPNKPNPTEKRILALLLDAWSDRLEPLAPINKKLTDLRSVLDSKLAGSGKRTSVRRGGTLGIESVAGHRVPVSQLSSGEQHLVAIFSQLLFATHTGSLILIDEPEISMHMSWQHAFLEDVERVASVSDLQVILATHSTGIINGRWDLTRELSLPPLEEDDLSDGMEHDESDLDDEA